MTTSKLQGQSRANAILSGHTTSVNKQHKHTKQSIVPHKLLQYSIHVHQKSKEFCHTYTVHFTIFYILATYGKDPNLKPLPLFMWVSHDDPNPL